MVKVNIAEASRRLEELVALAESGEVVVIERDAGASTRLVSERIASDAALTFDAERARERLAKLPMDPRPQEEIIARRKASERY